MKYRGVVRTRDRITKHVLLFVLIQLFKLSLKPFVSFWCFLELVSGETKDFARWLVTTEIFSLRDEAVN